MNSVESRAFFLHNINDEVIRAMSKLRYIPEKIEDKLYEKLNLDNKLVSEISLKFSNEHINSLHKSINHILHKHKKSRIFLIIMGKWFFIGILTFKYIIKGLIFYYIYKKSGSLFNKPKNQNKIENQNI